MLLYFLLGPSQHREKDEKQLTLPLDDVMLGASVEVLTHQPGRCPVGAGSSDSGKHLLQSFPEADVHKGAGSKIMKDSPGPHGRFPAHTFKSLEECAWSIHSWSEQGFLKVASTAGWSWGF